jgi:hypothetical protein
MAELTHLHVICYEVEADAFESLHNLKELTFKNSISLQELVISSHAEMTKLSVDCRLQPVRSKSHEKHPYPKS